MPGQEPKKSTPPRLPNFLFRSRAMSSGGKSGWEATTIGFTLVGCIGACSGLGYWLDARFGTSYWLPILFLIGTAAGFREMFVVLGRINKEQEQERLKAREKVKLAPPPSQTEEKPESQERERIFKVPPPPQPGQKVQSGEELVDSSASDSSTNQKSESVEELIERLLQDDVDGESKR
ncbi:hypothetical protein EON80_09215 [bacterium]|nr:MAG: hypothetical protein EON80_09215 [bacterium]